MDYIKLVIGLVLIMVFVWIFIRNFKRSGFASAVIRLDTVVAIIVGVYLVVTSFPSSGV